MRIVYAAPFRVDFSLTRDLALANHEEFKGIVEQAGDHLADLPGGAIGNYAWGKPPAEDAPLHGEKGVHDPAWFFREHFTVAFDLPAEAVAKPPGEDATLLPLWSEASCRGQVRLIDRTIALLCLDAEVPINAFLQMLRSPPDLIAAGNGWCEQALKGGKHRIDAGQGFAQQRLVEPLHARARNPDPDVFRQLDSPIYPLKRGEYRALWAHLALALDAEERDALARLPDLAGSLHEIAGRQDSVTRWLSGGANAYGWGASVVTLDPTYPDQWLEALLMSQYYYACLDVADTGLPQKIARLAQKSSQGHREDVQKEARSLRHVLQTLEADYADLRVRSAAEGGRGLQRYHEVWRFADLTTGLTRKQELLAELTRVAARESAERSQTKVQLILTAITILSFISLFSGLHDYLASDFDPSRPEWLPSMAVTVSRVSVLVASLVIAVLAYVAWILARRGR